MALNDKVIEYGKGQKLFVTLLDNRNLEGSYSRSSSARKAIILHNVSFVPFDGKSFEQLEFKFSEILRINCLEGEEIENKNADQSIIPAIPETPRKKHDGILYQKLKDNVANHVFIEHIDEKFSEAVKILERTNLITVVGQGSEQGRFGHLSVLGFATNNSVFLFDVVNLGARVFKASGSFLKKLLESKMVLKIVHNCSLLSDCLKHKYDITLRNVFDTQACHVIIVKNQSGHPPQSATLSNLISEYLSLPDGLCEHQPICPTVWRRRPLEAGMAEIVAWKVAVLQKLKPRMEDALFAPFDSLCQSYLSAVRSVDDELQARIEVDRHQRETFTEDLQ